MKGVCALKQLIKALCVSQSVFSCTTEPDSIALVQALAQEEYFIEVFWPDYFRKLIGAMSSQTRHLQVFYITEGPSDPFFLATLGNITSNFILTTEMWLPGVEVGPIPQLVFFTF